MASGAFSFDSVKGPLAIVGIIAMVVLIAYILWLFLKGRKRELSPLEVLVKNLKASALRLPARKFVLTGNGQVWQMHVGRLVGAIYTTHLAVLIVRPRGLFGFFKRNIVMAAPGDLQDLQGRTLFVMGTAIMRYSNDLFWLHPDLQDLKTRERWATILRVPKSHVESQESADALLSLVQEYYLDGVESFLAVQEELVAKDLNARTRRAIPFDRASWATAPDDPESRSAANDGRREQEQELGAGGEN